MTYSKVSARLLRSTIAKNIIRKKCVAHKRKSGFMGHMSFCKEK